MTGLLLRAWLSLGLWLGPPTQPPEPPEPPPAAAPATASNESAPITVTTRLTPEPSHIGDLLTLEVLVAYPSDHAINLPNGLDFSPLELVDIQPGPVVSTGRDLRQSFTITLQYFDVGEAAIPSFPVTWIDPDDQVHTYTVEPHPFVVEALLANESDPQPRGPDPMVSLEYPNIRLAEIIVAALGGLLLASLLAVAFVLWRRRERPVFVAPPRPPHERALAELEQLAREREALIAAAAYQDYYLRLTEIAKRYLGARFGFEALDRTTEEIQDLFARGQVRVEPLDSKAVLGFLQDCDLVKFARLSPPEQETVEALAFVRELVDESTPREQPPDGEATTAAVSKHPSSPERAASPTPGEPSDLEQPRASRPEPPQPPQPPSEQDRDREVSP